MTFVLKHFPIILITISYTIGILISNYFYISRSNVLILISLSLVILNVILEKDLKYGDRFKTYFALFSIIILSLSINSIRINKEFKGNKDVNSEIEITKLFNSSKKYQNCIVKDNYDSQKYLGFIKLRDSVNFNIGSKLFVRGKTKRLTSAAIPNNFDFTKYLIRRDVYSRLEVYNYVEARGKVKLSNSIEAKIARSNLSDTSKGLMKALVLGRKDAIPDELLDSFSDSGIMHLLALSGLHIGILTIILTFLLKPLKLFKRGKLIRSFIVVILLWYYAYITGFSSSIIRATIMFSIIVIGHGMKREINIFNSLAIAALVLLIINPNNLFDVGFQLSFSAVIGIVWILPLLIRIWRPRNRIVRYFWSLLLVSISAQLATFPFTVYYFHKFSGLFFIANIIEIPLITILLGLSYLILVLLSVGIEANSITYIYDKTVLTVQWVSLKISNVESMVFDNIFIDQIIVLLLIVMVISAVLFLQYKKTKYLFAVLIVVISIQVYNIFNFYKNLSTQRLMITKNEILIQNGHYYITNISDGARVFSNYTIANKLKLKSYVLDDVFNFNDSYYWRLEDNLKYNPIADNHLIIIGNKVSSNPELIVNKKTTGIIYSGYKKSSYRNRWEYFCIRNKIDFYDVNSVLFNEIYLE